MTGNLLKKIIVAGEIIAEFMAETIGNGFAGPMPIIGPYPSGAPAIYIDQVARLGQPCGIVSTVGQDDFGKLNIKRLSDDGVDISAIAIDPDRPTGTAFVRYCADGSRNFVFNIRHSACGTLPCTPATDALVAGADHLHITGSSLLTPEIVDLNLTIARIIQAKGGTVSFDPNVRKEMFGAPGVADAMRAVLAVTDLFLPSDAELALLAGTEQADDAVAKLLAGGVRAIVHKQGMAGAVYHDTQTRHFVPPFTVNEVDPTGAGDCFGAAFTVCWLRKMDMERALTIASAAGALAVTQKGGMEGAFAMPVIEDFIKSQGRLV